MPIIKFTLRTPTTCNYSMSIIRLYTKKQGI